MTLHTIDTRHASEIRALIVRMPALITLNMLNDWSAQLLYMLNECAEGEKITLLLDMNTHNFESIECLKYLREFLSCNQQIKNIVSRAAFVQPEQYRKPEIVSSEEAYFSKFEDAYYWIKQKKLD